jgi:hypothetical protein
MPSDQVLDDVAKLIPVGTRVTYYPIMPPEPFEPGIITTVRSEPWRLGHGAIVVKVNGRSGGVLVSHLRAEPSE